MIDVFVESTRIRIANRVATIVERVQDCNVRVAVNREWEPTLKSDNGRNLPSAEGQICRFAHVASEALSAAQRQLVHGAGHKSMIDVEIGPAIVQTRIEVVHMTGETTTIR